jgi:protein-S-isoprenylcysteine O-methyltransferase Ste14
MRAVLMAVYGVVVYAFFLVTFLYAVAFVGDFGTPTSLDRGSATSLGVALLVNLALLGVFAVQHSVMARPAFKRWWTRFVPRPIERSTYVLAASAALALLLWQWQPIGGPAVWTIVHPAAVAAVEAAFWLGWLIMLSSTFMINHFELFGLRQAFSGLAQRADIDPSFKTPLMYRYVRHPIYLGFLIAFWATPRMTLGHLLFAVATTAYVLIGIRLEEHDLVAQFGNAYRVYRKRVGMLLPSFQKAPR